MRYFLFLIFILQTNLVLAQSINSLINSNSPYLLQHAHNPVNWFEWNEDTILKAKKQDKLIFLSIGYSTCHWCQVMEKESFENEELAKLFNKDYISIKIDREVNSDLDIYYQGILSALKTRRNGWPLSVIMTPQLKVLHITTYIPPKFDYGTQGLDTILPKYANIYYNDENKLNKIISQNEKLILSNETFEQKHYDDIQKEYLKRVEQIYDDGFKGFFKRPRFPYAANLSLLYDIYDLSGDKKAKKMVYEPLYAMAKGGIYDQIEGAFFRYAVHPDWIIPHFEKMLYTTAELVPIYTRAYNDSKEPLFKKVVTKSLDQIQKRFFNNGFFYSASNADSNGKEGEYFLFKYDEAVELLKENGYKEDEIEKNLEYLDITTIGNFEDDLSNPHLNNNLKEDEKPLRLDETIKLLKKIRDKKQYPFIDKKVIVSWNAMMIKAYLIAGSIDKKYEIQGLEYLEKLIRAFYMGDQLYHYSIQNKVSTKKGLLEDYAFLADTLLYAYALTYDESYFNLADKLVKQALDKFYKNDTWYLSDEKIGVKANFIDRYYTSALGLMFSNLISISNFKYDISTLYKTKKMINRYKAQILSDMPNHSMGVKAMIRIKKGDIILKSNRSNLQNFKNEISKIKYPFIYTKVENERDFLACDESSCFGVSDDFIGIKTIIKNRIDK